MLFVILFIGLAIRIPLLPLKGFEHDFLFFASCAQAAEESVITCYDSLEELEIPLINYPPVYIYMLAGLARLYHLFSSNPLQSLGFLCLLKIWTIGFEILTAGLIYRWVQSRHGTTAGQWAFGLFFLNPAVFYVSAVFGQVDAIFAFFLLGSLLCLLEDRPFWGGALLAASLLMKIMTLPFLPLFGLIYLLRKDWKNLIWMLGGFLAASILLLSPYLLTGRLGIVYQRCFEESVQWGGKLTIGAFNLWALHATPLTEDTRIWGWLYGGDGQLSANPLFAMLTYKRLGMGLFGLAFLLTLSSRRTAHDVPGWLVAAAHIALAFFLLPTRMHERYLFPFFAFFPCLLVASQPRLGLYIGLSFTFLWNVHAICPLDGVILPLDQIYGERSLAIAVVNLVLYAWFLTAEYGLPRWPHHPRRVVGWAALGTGLGLALLLELRWTALQPHPGILLLSDLTPVSIQQDWPLVPAGQILKKDLSTDGNTLRIGDRFFAKGIGVHARSRIEYEIPPTHNLFEATIGVDAEIIPSLADKTPQSGTVIFSVWAGEEKLYESPLMLPSSPSKTVIVRLPQNPEPTRLVLLVEGGLDGIDSDHADWALARVYLTHPDAKPTETHEGEKENQQTEVGK